MLVNLKCFGTGLNTTVYVEVTPQTTIGELIALVGKVRPEIEVKRMLFAGKQLSDPNASLGLINIFYLM
jgi:hypothetical protein